MSAAEARPERIRLFVALDLPAAAKDAIERWRVQTAGEVRALRPIPPEALHVTLCFLGWRAAAEVEPVGAACAGALAGASQCRLSIGDGVWLPQRRPRVLSVELIDESGALGTLQTSLSAALSAGGWYAPEVRPFLAHVTVARVRGRARIRPLALPETPGLSFCAATVTLYRSRLGAGGARYEPLRTIELGEGGARPRRLPAPD